MIDFNKLIEFNMTRNCPGPISYPNVYERDRLVSEFLSLWVKAHTMRTIAEVEQCRTEACKIWWYIVDFIDPNYSLWDVDFKSTGYDQPLLVLPFTIRENPYATFHNLLTRMGKVEKWRNPDSQIDNQYSSSINETSAAVAAAASVLFM